MAQPPRLRCYLIGPRPSVSLEYAVPGTDLLHLEARLSAPAGPDAIPVIDLFAGPGGLGEGFASLLGPSGEPVFRLALSVEMDEVAHRTLELRAFHRQFADKDRPPEYHRYVASGWSTRARHDALLDAFGEREGRSARAEAWHHTLDAGTEEEERRRVDETLGSADCWVLVGGPPCQAYSLVGRSRRARDKTFEGDEKHTLYKRYLHIIEEFNPPIFVMENVKGLLSARLGDDRTFDLVKDDLSNAGRGYRVLPFVASPRKSDHDPEDYVIRSELFGVPQARHRVILLGVRDDVAMGDAKLRQAGSQVQVESVLRGLPRKRSRLSGRSGGLADSEDAWLSVLDSAAAQLARWDAEVGGIARDAALTARQGGSLHHGRLATNSDVKSLLAWLHRGGRRRRPINHEPRSHMEGDIQRYLFCASYAACGRGSPRLQDFPDFLMPAHANAREGKFNDRFRVQLRDHPASTVASHISKDGHYYIHYDPSQCRSLTVREAARLQTFPDDYFFEGTRTQQYHQVGNAVPPFLALQLAEVVAQALGIRVR